MGSTLLSSLSIGRETLMSHGTAMAALADNVSNSNTTGFKSGLPQFEDILARGQGSIQDFARTSAGDGAAIDRVKSVLTQGALEPTENPYDLAVDGTGYFVVARPDADGNATSEVYYTRAGDFELNQDGQLVNSQGLLVMAFEADGETLSPITLAGRDATPSPTTTATVVGNLDADTAVETLPVPATIASSTDILGLNPFSTSINIVDSLGSRHDVQLSFFKTGVDAAGTATWEVRAFADGADIAGGTPGTLSQIGALNPMQIGNNGIITGAAALSLTANWLNGGSSAGVNVDLSKFTGYSSASFVSATTQDGKTTGIVDGIEFDKGGAINVVLSNGDRTQIGTLALARFPNEIGLERAGNTIFQATADAGEVTYAAPQIDGRGMVNQNRLETSNVDLADQFVNVIRIQRTYQAGSQVIQTTNDLLNTTIQIV